MGLTSQIITLLFQKPPITRTSPPQGRQKVRAEFHEENIVSGAAYARNIFLASASWIFSKERKAKMLLRNHIAYMLRFGLRSVPSKLEPLRMLPPCFINRVSLIYCTAWRKEKKSDSLREKEWGSYFWVTSANVCILLHQRRKSTFLFCCSLAW